MILCSVVPESIISRVERVPIRSKAVRDMTYSRVAMVMIGGAEGDTFFGQEGADRFVIAGGVSWIMDFDAAEGDRIEEKIDLYMRSLHKIRNFRTEAS